jgi:hypothetical protein
MKTMDKKGKNIKVSRIRAYKRYGIKKKITIVAINNLNKCRTTFGYGVPQLANICCII